MINKIKEFMSNQVEETSAKKAKKKKEAEEHIELLQQIETLKGELDESKDKYIRLFAEFDNFKKRSVKERFELMKTAAQETIAALLPTLDDFDRAKKSAESGAETFSEGVNLVYQKLYSTLEHKGLKSMESTGADFDPEWHEAITDIPAPSEEMKGKVIDTIEKGYLLNDKIIRYAKVVVAK
jgi:molecular chaperone GrpE